MRRPENIEVEELSAMVDYLPVLSSGSSTKENYELYAKYFENDNIVGEFLIPG